jgi:SRSO17 transposase
VWEVEPVRARVAKLVDEAISPAAWAIDDTELLKCGIRSPCVARQYTGTAGKVTNCQVAVSVSMVTGRPQPVCCEPHSLARVPALG